MPENVVLLKRNGSVPQIELTFGFAQFAKYQIFLFDTQGQNPVQVAHGINIDAIPDKFPVGSSVAALDGCFITWQAVIASPTGGPGQQFSQKATFTQDDSICLNSPFTQAGPLNNTITTFDQAKFQVVE
ncbi:MAG TPA: hypothetical protein VFD75_19435 [Pyrinomonadaceae bacterium]|nr:hypothetical protein [Pyrinomonadaceae bacterium]